MVKISKSKLALALTVIASLCIIPCGSIIIVSRVDAAFCLPRTAQKLGVAPSYSAIHAYIRASVQPDMTRAEVISILSQVGPVRVPFSTKVPNEDTFRDQIHIDICWFPLNDILLHLYYEADDQRVLALVIDED